MGLKGRDDRLDREQEDPGVPQVLPAVQHCLSSRAVGLFNKALKRLWDGRKIGRRCLAHLQPAIAGLGPVGADAECHKLAVLRRWCRGLHGGPKSVRIRDHMIGRCNKHERFRRAGSEA